MLFGRLTGADLRLFLQLLDIFQREERGFLDDIRADPHDFVSPEASNVSWCDFYEKSFVEHVQALSSALEMGDLVRHVASSPRPYKAMVDIAEGLDAALETATAGLSEEQRAEMRKELPLLLPLIYSLCMSLRSLLVYGRYLNDLIRLVREKRDRDALLAAVKIDTTCLGCPSVAVEIGRARLKGDKAFFKRLRNAIEGKFTKREQANFQKMRVIFQVLKETGAIRLSDAQLYELFVNELNLYASDSVRGDVKKNLRKLATQYLKKDATT